MSSIKCVAGYRDVFGHQCGQNQLKGIIRKYSIFDWISFISRLQTLLAPPNHECMERQRTAFNAVTGPKVKAMLRRFALSKGNPESAIFCTSTQLETLQQFVFAYGDDLATAGFNSDDDRNNFAAAILMAWDITHPEPVPTNRSGLLAHLIRDRVRWQRENLYDLSTRACFFYQIFSSQKSVHVLELERLFKMATGHDLAYYIMGAMCVAIKESVLTEKQLAAGWSPTISPVECIAANQLEAKCINVFHELRCAEPNTIKAAIERWDGTREPEAFTYIGLKSYPIVNFPGRGRFVNNLSTILDSVFSGVRHSILSQIGKRVKGVTHQDLGGIYGDAFEGYVLKLIQEAFGGSYFTIPDEPGFIKADGVIVLPTAVLVFEIKGAYPNILKNYYGLKTAHEREIELEDMQVKKAADQLASTIDGIRSRGLLKGAFEGLNWNKTTVVPVIITQEELPRFAGCEIIYYRLTKALRVLPGPVTRARFLSARDVERLPDLVGYRDVGRMFIDWSEKEFMNDTPLRAYMHSEKIDFPRNIYKHRVMKAIEYLAEFIGLDANKLNWPEDYEP